MASGPKKGVLRGPKISNKHQTIIPGADKLILAAKAMECVSKVVVAEILPVGTGKPKLKFQPVQAGLRMIVRSGINQQTFYVYTSDPQRVELALSRVWQEMLG